MSGVRAYTVSRRREAERHDEDREDGLRSARVPEVPPVDDPDEARAGGQDEQRDERRDVRQVVEREPAQPRGEGSARAEERHDPKVHGTAARHRAEADQDASSEQCDRRARARPVAHAPMQRVGRLQLPARVGQEDVANHPEPHGNRDQRRDPTRQMIAGEPGERRHDREQAHAQEEVREKHSGDEERAEPEDGAARGPDVGRGPCSACCAGLPGGEAERERSEQDEDAERAGVEPVQKARRDDRRNAQVAQCLVIRHPGAARGDGDRRRRDDEPGDREEEPGPRERRGAHGAGHAVTVSLPCMVGFSLPPQQMSQ